MQRTFTNIFPVRWYLILIILFIPILKGKAQTNPKINAVNGLLPSCITEDQSLNLIINGVNFTNLDDDGAIVRIKGTAFTREVFFTPQLPKSATQIKIEIPANSIVVSNPGILTIDIQQTNLEGNKVFSNAVQMPVYPKTGAINGSISVCGNTQTNYSVPILAGAASYEWSIISGNATIVSGGTSYISRIGFTNNPGTVRIAVKTINSCGTVGTTSTLDVMVKSTPTAGLPAFNNICANAPAIALTSGTPAGGSYTVNGVLATTFDPAAVGVGEHTITYYFTQNGCTASASQLLNVLPLPQVVFPTAFNPVCLNANPISLAGGSPAGGIYTGPGVEGTSFNPAVAGVGKHTISYTVNQNGCSNTAIQTIDVIPSPTAGLPAFNNICANAPAIALTGGTPAGGSYTVNGVLATTFDPAAVGVGEHTITYNFTQNGCTASASQTIRVILTPDATFPVTLAPVCINAEPLVLTKAVSTGGTFSGSGVIMDDDIYQSVRYGLPNTTFSYNIPVNNGQYIVILHFADNNWTQPRQRSFDVNIEGIKVLDNYDIVDKVGPKTATTEMFTVNTIDGTINIDFIGLNSEGGISDPTVCAIEVKSVTTPSEVYRINAGAAQSSYAGNEFSEDKFFTGANTFIFDNPVGGTPTFFDPNLAGVGDHTITYLISKNGCQNSSSQNISVLNLPVASISAPASGTQVCQGAFVTLSSTQIAGATFQWLLNGNPISGATNATFSANISGSYAVQVTANNCSNISNSIEVTILAPANIILAEQSPVAFCTKSQTTLQALTGNGYQYQWYKDGIILNTQTNATLLVNQPGAYNVILTPVGCEPISSSVILVSETPEITNNIITTSANQIICTGSTIDFAGSSVSGGSGEYTYQWQSSINNAPFSVFDNSETNQNYSYFSDNFTGSISFRRIVISGSCSSISNEVKITVNQVISNNTITATNLSAICPESSPGTITGSSVTGATNFTYAWERSSFNQPFAVIAGATSSNFTPEILTQTTTFRRVIISGQCVNISNEVTINVKPDILGNSISVLSDFICSKEDPGIIKGDQVTGGDGTYNFIWERSLDGTNFTSISNTNTADYNPGVLIQTTVFRRVITSGGCVNTSNEITIKVNNNINGNNISVTTATICSDVTPGTITGSRVTGGDGIYNFVWENSLDGITFDTIPNSNTEELNPGLLTQTTTFRRVVTSGPCTEISNAVTITVIPIATYTVFLTVPASGFPICEETTYSARVIKNVDVIIYPTDPHYQQVRWAGGEDVTQQFLFEWWKNDEIKIENSGSSLTLGDLQPGDFYTVRARPTLPNLPCVIYNNRPDLVSTNLGANVLFSNKMYLGQPDAYAVSISSELLDAICPGTPVTLTATPNDPDYENQSFQWIINGQDIPEATQPTFISSEIKNNDVISVRFNSTENRCNPIMAVNPITVQVTEPIVNRIEKVNGPNQPEVGQPATYQAVPVDNSITWTYRWNILYDTAPNPTSETFETDTPDLIIRSVRADMIQIGVEQLAPDGTCVDALISPNLINGDIIPLPVELIYFKAKKQAKNVILLEWATTQEKDNEGFEVQVSQDAINFRTLTFIPTQNGNSTTKLVYNFYDHENGKYGTRYYRLKQIDLGGKSTFIGPVAIKMEDLEERIIAYPNPFKEEITLEIVAHEAGIMQLFLINSIGSKVMHQTRKISKGINKEVLPVNSQLPIGIYTIITQMNGRTSHLKVLKK